MSESYNKMLNLCVEMISELSNTIVFAADNLSKAEVDSHVLLDLIKTSTKKMEVINQEHQLELAKEIAKLTGEIDELKANIRRRGAKKGRDSSGSGSGTEGVE